MKIPALKSLGNEKNIQASDALQSTIKEQKALSVTIVRRTFSLESFYAEHIEKIAAQLSQERGKPVNASQALRVILKRDMESRKT